MSMGPQVTFSSEFFNPVHGEDEQTNPERFGKALAEWLASCLKQRGVSVEGVLPEDFGWVVMIARKPVKLWFACGNTDGSTTEWSVYSVAEVPLLQRLFKGIDPARELEELNTHLVELVPQIPGISNVAWES